MINLHTGLPGNGKTLFTIPFVRDLAKREARPVFYAGIELTEKGVTELGWHKLDDEEKWYECPPGSIVLIDEAQRIFRPRSTGAAVPKHVSELETHRHKGFDLFLITQNPMLIDNAVRRLAGKHRHIMRMFGTQAATIHEWDSVRIDCDKPGRRQDSDSRKWVYDRSVYELYKSAELHTVTRSIPKKLVFLVVAPFLVAAFGYLAYWKLHGMGKKQKEQIGGSSVTVGASSASVGTAATAPGRNGDSGRRFDPVQDAREYVWANTPRVSGVAHTAPKYDSITTPTAAPVPAACVYAPRLNRCQCYSQQGTKLDVQYNVCLDIANNGFFQDFDPNGHQERRERAIAALDRPDGQLPLSHADTSQRPYAVAVLGDGSGYGVLGSRPSSGGSGAVR